MRTTDAVALFCRYDLLTVNGDGEEFIANEFIDEFEHFVEFLFDVTKAVNTGQLAVEYAAC